MATTAVHVTGWKNITAHHTSLAVDAVKVEAWRGKCACGWESVKLYTSCDDARAAAEEHRDVQRRCGL